ncbi:glycogen debranching protein [Capsulimonas corticalis]|uniref:Glycogen debranching protein n=1 Tax=Capsulimonas corticalis TaxID=2219043 RepID=A0A402CYN3_9BACT|nr:amylo-alpha-1,6-glucosidase [Capsulimonas corticalis]BDI31273.1 glycogen debranching protein [Capsulimonas corticalis]
MTWITRESLQNWEESSRREWLVTNGIGGYGSASIAGANTRRYHGLLVPAFEPPLGRAVLFSKIEEEVRIEDELYLLSANKYPSLVHPQGYRHLVDFTPTPVPTFTYVFHEDTVVLEKRIWMAHGDNTVYIQYHLIKAPEFIKLGLVPLMAYKDYHTEQHRWDGFHGTTTSEPDGTLKFVAFDDAHPLFLHTEPPYAFTDHSGWFYNFEHAREAERGLDSTEDLYCPGRFDGTLNVGETMTIVATVETTPPARPDAALAAEEKRQAKLLTLAGLEAGGDAVRELLTIAADQFVIEKTPKVARATIIAGYPWFTDWGRDTMIALPGLCLTTRRYDVAREILSTFAGATRNGLIPNRFSDGGGEEYNTVDASLWFFHAAHQYAAQSGDWTFATGELLPVFEDILQHHIAGTDFQIKADPEDGLLSAGEAGVQLTWMDARVGDWVVTPRTGKPVEINALWYNALRVTALLAQKAGDDAKAKSYEDRAAAVKKSFLAAFWNPATHNLFDVINADGRPDPTLRPNQIFAVSLPFAVLDGDEAREVVDAVEKALLTPYGLRTLAPGLPDYHPHYGPGDQGVRDGAYHQGTVWPWLIGAFAEAHLKAYGDKARVREILEPLLTEGLRCYCIGSVPEIFDADEPFAPNGCVAQAWSVSELLRTLAAVS